MNDRDDNGDLVSPVRRHEVDALDERLASVEEAITEIKKNTTEMVNGFRELAKVDQHLKQLIEMQQDMMKRLAPLETHKAVMDSHEVVKTLESVKSNMPSLIEMRTTVNRGVFIVVMSIVGGLMAMWGLSKNDEKIVYVTPAPVAAAPAQAPAGQ